MIPLGNTATTYRNGWYLVPVLVPGDTPAAPPRIVWKTVFKL